MKPTILWGAFALCVGAAHSAPAPQAHKRPLNVAVLLYPDLDALDATGPLEAFRLASELEPRAFNVYTVAQTGAPLLPHGASFSMVPRYSFAGAPRPDIVIVPGGPMKTLARMEKNQALMNWVREGAKAPQLMSVCTGSFLLARAGVLDGKRATTHWFVTSELAQGFPRVQVRQNVRFVEDGNVLTTAGVSSGIDGALRLIGKMRGADLANQVAQAMQYRPNTPAFPLIRLAPRPVANAVLAPGQKPALDHDPVCGMKLGPDDKTFFAYNGKIYGFCSVHCRDRFAAHPEEFLHPHP